MRYRRLGQRGPQVSEIGFGTWGLGGTHGGAVAYGPTDDRESAAALNTAFDRGLTFFDTSDLYGHGHAESLLGEVFEARRGKIVIATKAGFLGQDGSQDFSPPRLRQVLEASLRRLRTDYVDLLQLHSPPADLLTTQTGILDELQRLRAEGKVRSLGISVRAPQDGLFALEFPFDAIQVNFSLTDQRALEIGLLEACSEKGVGVIARTPLCFGFLTGAFGAARFAADDHRSRWPEEQRRRWHEAVALFEETIQALPGQTPAQFALRFCLSHEAISAAIPGMLTEAHVQENLRASDCGPLSRQELQRVQELYRSATLFVARKDGA